MAHIHTPYGLLGPGDDCPLCGQTLMEADEIVNGDVGTDHLLLMCDTCGETFGRLS